MTDRKERPTERAVKARIKSVIDLYGRYNELYTLCPMTMGYGESGSPDRLLLINGRLIGIEAKRDGANAHDNPSRKPTRSEAAQKLKAGEIRAAGGEWICVNSATVGKLVVLIDSFALHGSRTFTPADKAKLAKLVGEG